MFTPALRQRPAGVDLGADRVAVMDEKHLQG
jgi:hypothetical protein